MSAIGTPMAAEQLTVIRGGATLLRGIDLQLQTGELHVLLGPNGAGKSTLLRTLAGEWPASRGRVVLAGEPLARWRVEQQARWRAMLPQQDALAFGFTVRELVGLGRHAALTKNAAEEAQLIDAVLAATDLAALAHRSYPTLSGGERRRAQLARVLAQIWDVPDAVLLLDEPTHSLDLAHQHLVLALLCQLTARGVAVLASLHDLNLAAVHAHRISLLRDGALLATGVPQQVLVPSILQKLYGTTLDFSPIMAGDARHWLVRHAPGG